MYLTNIFKIKYTRISIPCFSLSKLRPAKRAGLYEYFRFVAGDKEKYLSRDGLRFLVGLRDSAALTFVDLSFSRLDLDLRPLEQITGLEILILDNCGITDQHDLQAAPTLRTLRYLNTLWNTISVSDWAIFLNFLTTNFVTK